ncbi:hypothetical protein [[Clostridium] scindens]|uniref:hypothetical protein n=1 Tax=Clostridium scindens (strain JCM 10418 / VPI 12708) TaxID=29347 RepID=UPI00241DD4D2|nr:hypothetical protein [[Clostridium] scindens]WPB21596.1 hypothetical protein GAFPHCNK_01045 [[Clostridium] scindens]
MDFITSDIYGNENGYLRHSGIDINVGTENTFEIKIQNKYFDKARHWYRCRVYAPGTEYGGIVRAVNPITEDGIIKIKGPTWRGLLNKKAIHPDKNDYLVLSGEANAVLAGLVRKLGLSEVFSVSSEHSGVYLDYVVPLQSMLLDAITRALEAQGARLDIKYFSGETLGRGYALLSARPIQDLSETIEISEDGNVKLNILDYQDGANHLICLGKGELASRQRVDLYAWPDGTIRKQQYYTGMDENVEYYENTSVETLAELEEEAREKFEDKKNYKQLKISVSGLDLELGDIVGGRERITGITMASPVVRKILTVTGKGRESIDYKLKGDD